MAVKQYRFIYTFFSPYELWQLFLPFHPPDIASGATSWARQFSLFYAPPPFLPLATVNHTSFLALSISILILTILPKMGHFAETAAGMCPGFACESDFF